MRFTPFSVGGKSKNFEGLHFYPLNNYYSILYDRR